MAAFSYQHPFPHPFLLDSVFPQQNTTAASPTPTPTNYLKNMSSSPTGLFMEEPGSSAMTINFPQFYPPEFFLLHSSGFDPAAAASGLPLPLPLPLQQDYYAFASNNDCNIDINGDNIQGKHKADDCELGDASQCRNGNYNEEEDSVVTRKQSTHGGHSSTTESGGEQVNQFKSTPPVAAKKRKNIVIGSNHNNNNNLSNGSSHLDSSDSKEAREAGKSNKKAKKSCDVVEVVEEETKKKKKRQEKTGDGAKQSKKEEKQRKKGGDDKELPPTGYIHVRARRGQATDSHSLAERARREKISERMKMLQHLVPGCDKVTGNALMLDEIINYIQSLQNQVEFLSMKLAAVNPLFYDFGLDLDGLMVRPERLSSNSPPLPMPSSVQPCNPTTTTVQQPRPSDFAATTAAASISSCYPLITGTTTTTITSAIFAGGQRQGDFSQSQDNGGSQLLWDMEVEDGRQKFVNQSSGFGIGSTITTTNNNNNFCSFH